MFASVSVDAKALELHLHTEMKRQRSPQQFTMFPTISLAHSMPVFPEEAKNFSFSKVSHCHRIHYFRHILVSQTFLKHAEQNCKNKGIVLWWQYI